jgi:thioredoxin-related protein
MAGALCSAALVFLAASPSWSAELLMFRRAGCPYCLTWDRVVGPAYPKSDLGGRLPLRTIDLDRDLMPEAKLDRPVRFTPTFVLVDDGREVGRIEGYPGEDFFWGLLERLVRSRPSAVQSNYDMDRAAGPRRGVIG